MKKNQKTKKGILVVIEGSDGSGKATQSKMLNKHLVEDGYKAELIDFPQYGNNILGALIGECLAGEHGDFAKLDPKIASVLYAADRFESKDKTQGWLREGKIVIADRYVSANQMHQGGKVKDDVERRNFLFWLDKLEFEVFQIPRPDAIYYLDVPIPKTQELLSSNEKEMKNKKKYLRRRSDIVESNLSYQHKGQEAAARIIKERNSWTRIECMKNGVLLPKEVIHNKIYKLVLALIYNNETQD